MSLFSTSDTKAQALAKLNNFTSNVQSSTVSTTGPSIDDLSALGFGIYSPSELPVVSDGTLISSFPNSEGGNIATSSGSARPQYKTAENGVNGQPMLRYNGSSAYMATATGAPSASEDFYVGMVVRFNTITSADIENFVSFGDQSTAERRSLCKGVPTFHDNALIFIGQSGDGSSDVYSNTPVFQSDSVYLLEMQKTGSVVSIYVNGSVVATGSPTLSDYSSTALVFGASPAFAEFLNADSGVIAIHNNPSDADIEAFRQYCLSAYAIRGIASGAPLLQTQTAKIAGITISPSDLESVMSFDGPGINVLAVLNTSDTDEAYSTFAFIDPDLLYERGAIGLGKSNDALYPWRSVYLEAFEGRGNPGSILPIRLVQTRNSGGYNPFRRIECVAPTTNGTGSVVIYRTNAPYPNESPALIVRGNGQINMAALPTSASGLSSGDIWNDSGTLKIV